MSIKNQEQTPCTCHAVLSLLSLISYLYIQKYLLFSVTFSLFRLSQNLCSQCKIQNNLMISQINFLCFRVIPAIKSSKTFLRSILNAISFIISYFIDFTTAHSLIYGLTSHHTKRTATPNKSTDTRHHLISRNMYSLIPRFLLPAHGKNKHSNEITDTDTCSCENAAIKASNINIHFLS